MIIHIIFFSITVLAGILFFKFFDSKRCDIFGCVFCTLLILFCASSLIVMLPAHICQQDALNEVYERIEELDLQYKYLSSFNDYTSVYSEIERYNARANDFIENTRRQIRGRANTWTSWYVSPIYTTENIDLSQVKVFESRTIYSTQE